MKTGVPIKAVITPTGSSEAPVTTRAKASQATRKMPPRIADVGINILWSGPISSLVMWGIIRPTNPITPLIETTAPVINEPKTRRVSLTFLCLLLDVKLCRRLRQEGLGLWKRSKPQIHRLCKQGVPHIHLSIRCRRIRLRRAKRRYL